MRRTPGLVAAAAVLALTVAGCSDEGSSEQDSGPPPVPSQSAAAPGQGASEGEVDTTDPQSVAEAWGVALANGDCEAGAAIHLPDDNPIRCEETEDHNDWVGMAELGLRFKSATPNAGDSTATRKNFDLQLNLPDGSIVEDVVILEKSGSEWLVYSAGPYPGDYDEPSDS
ncbi:hypothetical protein ACFS2C_02955 [Prauserella oleivorans]|uniref:DUF4878 domain-containing protein n=1 Tax=Prauserella oleivorans TaxID=1478153 RepID=A0ABW5W647_9PSEU